MVYQREQGSSLSLEDPQRIKMPCVRPILDLAMSNGMGELRVKGINASKRDTASFPLTGQGIILQQPSNARQDPDRLRLGQPRLGHRYPLGTQQSKL